MLNQPLKYIDPSGHAQISPDGNSALQISYALRERGHRLRGLIGRYPRVAELESHQSAALQVAGMTRYYEEGYVGEVRDESTEFAIGLATLGTGIVKGPALIRALVRAGSVSCSDGDCSNELTAAQGLIRQVQSVGGNINPDAVQRIGQTTSGRVVWIENGNATSGAEHILQKASQYEGLGLSKDKILDFVMAGATRGTQVGIQGRDRPIFEFIFEGKLWRAAIQIGSNGYIVGANPVESSVPVP